MPRNQGTSRKGKPRRAERATGMGMALQKQQHRKQLPVVTMGRSATTAAGGGMAMHPGMGMATGTGTTTTAAATTPNDPHTVTPAATTRSILELHDLDDFLVQADMANRAFAADHVLVMPGGSSYRTSATTAAVEDTAAHVYRPPVVRFATDPTSTAAAPGSPPPSHFVFTELSVPRRPAWDARTTPAQLQAAEEEAFVAWRRGIAAQEEVLRTRNDRQLQQQQQQHLIQQNQLSWNTIMASSLSSQNAVTPFEKNLQVWRQLWRVLERCSCLLQLVDARNPLFYLSDDLRQYAASLGKPMMILINKADYLSGTQRKAWKHYFTTHSVWQQVDVVFFSASREQEKLDQMARQERLALAEKHILADIPDPNDNLDDVDVDADADHDDDQEDDEEKEEENREDIEAAELEALGIQESNRTEKDDNNIVLEGSIKPSELAKPDNGNVEGIKTEIPSPSSDAHGEDGFIGLTVGGKSDMENDDALDGVDHLLTREDLIKAMLRFAHRHQCQPDPRYDDRIQFGMVGFPNVGKSSVINVLVGSSKHAHGMVRVGVASQPGKTKHFQTLLLPDHRDVMLCDCPGLVFPSFVSNTADLIAAGVYPIAQMRDYRPVIQLICQRIPREMINALYNIQLPVPAELPLTRVSQPNGMHDGPTQQQRSALLLPPPTPDEFLDTYCYSRAMVMASSGLPDHHRAARGIIQDYATGKLLFCHAPPHLNNTSTTARGDRHWFDQETVQTALSQTQKLRDRIMILAQQQEQQQAQQAKEESSTDPAERALDPAMAELVKEQVLMDSNILDIFEDETLQDPSNNSNRDSAASHKKHYKLKKAKKGSKNRNSDPYGCHSTPATTLSAVTAAASSRARGGGVVVNAGKHSASGYTRPTTYGRGRGGGAGGGLSLNVPTAAAT